MNSTLAHLKKLEERLIAKFPDIQEEQKSASSFDRIAHLRKLASAHIKIDRFLFAKMYQAGIPAREIGQILKMHPATATWLARKLGIYKAGGTIKPKAKISVPQCIAFYLNGRSTYEISRLLECSQGHVYNVLKRARITLRKAGRASSTLCKILECRRPAEKFTVRGCSYTLGSLCKFHRRMAANERARNYQRRKKNIPPSRWRLGRPDDEEFTSVAAANSPAPA